MAEIPSTPTRALARSLSELIIPSMVNTESDGPAQEARSEEQASSFWQELLNRCVEVFRSSLVAAPFEAVYIAAAVGRGGRACPNGFRGNWIGFARISRSENILGLWKGNLARSLSVLLPFVGETLLRRYYLEPSLRAEAVLQESSDVLEDEERKNLIVRRRLQRRIVVALFFAGILVVRHILELLAFRMYYHGKEVAPSLIGTFRHIVQTRGFAGLLRGLPLTLIQAYTHVPQLGCSPLPLQALKISQMVAEGAAEGTVAQITRIVREQGLAGFFSGWRCYFFSILPQEACQWLCSLLVLLLFRFDSPFAPKPVRTDTATE